MDWYSISFIVFMIVVATMIFKNRKKVTVKYYVFYRYDTKISAIGFYYTKNFFDAFDGMRLNQTAEVF